MRRPRRRRQRAAVMASRRVRASSARPDSRAGNRVRAAASSAAGADRVSGWGPAVWTIAGTGPAAGGRAGAGGAGWASSMSGLRRGAAGKPEPKRSGKALPQRSVRPAPRPPPVLLAVSWDGWVRPRGRSAAEFPMGNGGRRGNGSGPGQLKRSPPAVKVHSLSATVSSIAASEVRCSYSCRSWR